MTDADFLDSLDARLAKRKFKEISDEEIRRFWAMIGWHRLDRKVIRRNQFHRCGREYIQQEKNRRVRLVAERLTS